MNAWSMVQNLLEDMWDNKLKKSQEKMGQIAFFDNKIILDEGDNS